MPTENLMVVKRTARRPAAERSIFTEEARTLFIVLVLLSFLLVLTLNTMTILLSVAALALAWVYPFMKRYTHLPQVVLGAAFGWSIPMAFSAVSESLPLSCWLMFLANILWAVAYAYPVCDAGSRHDVKIGIKSTAILFGENDRLIIGIPQVAVLALMGAVGWLNGWAGNITGRCSWRRVCLAGSRSLSSIATAITASKRL